MYTHLQFATVTQKLNACTTVDIHAHYTCVQMETGFRHQAEMGMRVPRDRAALQGSRQPAHQTLHRASARHLSPVAAQLQMAASHLGDAAHLNADLCTGALQEDK